MAKCSSTAVEGKVSLMSDLPRPKLLYVLGIKFSFLMVLNFISGHTTSKLRLLILEAVVTLPLGSPGKIIQGTDIQDGTRAGKA